MRLNNDAIAQKGIYFLLEEQEMLARKIMALGMRTVFCTWAGHVRSQLVQQLRILRT